ncbi:hypothetical protein H2201_004533 [Coniosporium apollinis]|uniref:Conserved oligomeric Golgi complex subunit 1 n=1 Tax=Coniosporium apollinis TaxID=61459 RepID=A0ABQ9NVW1_9PEZI|nr:hypothetical protein H2201_004533 [Coniosporium apollinis]
MTTGNPDPRNLNTWEDAFRYPIPVVRKLEQQLRKHDSENRAKLRSLVGASYRDLLETAERIIGMNEQIQQVETTLGSMGQRCNTRAIEWVCRNHARLEQQWSAQDHERYTLASQLAVLQSCPMVISRLLKKDGSRLLAAKLLVISRLLHKTLSQLPDAPPLLDTLRSRLASFRRKLLKSIDRSFCDTEALPHCLVEDMCAFSLATSSTPTDVLRHFHHVRLETISQSFRDRQGILLALNCFTRTLLDTQRIFPKELADSLVELKARPLLQDKSVQSVTELNFDIHGKWIADEVRNFTLWPRHEELQRTEAERMCKAWAKQALDVFLKGTKAALAEEEDLRALVAVRKEILDTWLPLGSRLPGINSATVLDELREVLNVRLCKVIGDRVGKLTDLFLEIRKTLGTWQPGMTGTTTALWSPAMTSMPLSNGATAFKQAILDCSNGRNASVLKIIAAYNQWAASISAINVIIKEMKDTRWDDDLAADDEDEFGLDSKQALLSEDDPHTLSEAVDEALTTTFNEFVRQLRELIAQASEDSPVSTGNTTSQVMFLLRVLREVSQRLSGLNSRHDPTSGPSPSDRLVSLADPLHQHIAIAVSSPAISAYAASLQKLTRAKSVPARALWEGSPPLPVQPSPATFGFLRKLATDMADYGPDLWAPGAVKVLKLKLIEEVGKVVHEHMERVDVSKNSMPNGTHTEDTVDADGSEATGNQDTQEDGHGPSASSANKLQIKKDKYIQLLFDTLYLKRAFSVPAGDSSSEQALDVAVRELEARAAPDGAAGERVRKNAADYWKRTYLLFALLA